MSAPPPLVSVVVPTLDEARALPSLLDHLGGLAGLWEVVVADGGSADGSAEAARAHPVVAQVVVTGRGRAGQLNAGAAAARGELLVFVHADSRLPPGAWSSLAGAALAGREGGNFRLSFGREDAFARGLETFYRLQRRVGMYYGDSSIWVRRDVWERLGGFRPLPVMDDYDFARRLEARGRTACLPGPALTSTRRWRRLGVGRTVLSWVVIWGGYVAGVAPARLAGLYRLVR